MEVEAEVAQRLQEAALQQMIALAEEHRVRTDERAAEDRAGIAKEMASLDQQRLSPELRKPRLDV